MVDFVIHSPYSWVFDHTSNILEYLQNDNLINNTGDQPRDVSISVLDGTCSSY